MANKERKLRINAESVKVEVKSYGIYVGGKSLEDFIKRAFNGFEGEFTADVDFYLDEVDTAVRVDSDFEAEKEENEEVENNG